MALNVANGFGDMQVNGCWGVDFSSPRRALNEIVRVTQALRDAGTGAYCATIITRELEECRRHLPLIAAAMGMPGVKGSLLGTDLEGPYLSPEEGARGAHAPDKMRPSSNDEFDRFQESAFLIKGNYCVVHREERPRWLRKSEPAR
jgi:N-acetylglucosamine-6-phosphate deacetylase